MKTPRISSQSPRPDLRRVQKRFLHRSQSVHTPEGLMDHVCSREDSEERGCIEGGSIKERFKKPDKRRTGQTAGVGVYRRPLRRLFVTLRQDHTSPVLFPLGDSTWKSLTVRPVSCGCKDTLVLDITGKTIVLRDPRVR